MLDEVGESIVETASLLCLRPTRLQKIQFDPGGTELRQSLSANQRVGINGGDHAARNAGGDQSVRARSCTSVMGAGLQRYKGGGAANVMPRSCRLRKRSDLCMVARLVIMRAFAEDLLPAR